MSGNNQSQVDLDSFISRDSDKEIFFEDDITDNNTSDYQSKISGHKIEHPFSKHKTEKLPQAKDQTDKFPQSEHSAHYETRAKSKVTRSSHSDIKPESTTFQKTRQRKPKQDTKPVICPKIPEITITDRLHNACVMGKVDVVKEIMAEHFLKWMPDEQGRTPLYTACLANQKEVVECLVEIGFDVNHRDNEGKTPLHIVFENNLTEMARLLRHRFDAMYKLRDKRKWTPYHSAVDHGYRTCAERLLKEFLKQDLGTELSWLHLHAACHENKLETVQLLLEHKVDVNHICSEGQSALYIACTKNNMAIVKLLVQHGADPNVLCPRDGTALHVAVLAGNQELIESLLTCPNIDVNIENYKGDSSLHVAAYKHNAQALAALLEHETDLNKVNDKGHSLLHIAIRNHDDTTVKLLLQKGADPNQKDLEGSTCLLAAARNKNESIVTLLLEAKADVTTCSESGNTVLHHMVHENSSPHIVQKMIDQGAPVNAINKLTQTALNLACMDSNLEFVQVLLKAGADPNIADDRGETSLHWAVAKKLGPQIVQALLDHGASIDYVDYACRTALMLACKDSTNDEVVELLLTAGANPNIPDQSGETCLHWVIHAKFNSVTLQAVIDHGAKLNVTDGSNRTALMLACSRSQPQAIKILLNSGADPDIVDPDGETCLFAAVRNDVDADTIQEIIDHGVQLEAVDRVGRTALLMACGIPHDDAIQVLVKAGADTNVKDIEGEGCLHWAVHEVSSLQTLQLLIEHVADINATDSKGRSALYLACDNTTLPAEYVNELLKAGANSKVDTKDGNSPLHLAVLSKNAAKVALLLQHGADRKCKNSNGHTPYDCALLKKNKEVIKLFANHDTSLVKGGVSSTEPVLHYHCRVGNADAVVALLKEGVDKDKVYRHDTALEVALVNEHTDIVHILIDAGANVSTSASAYKLTFLARIYHQRHMRMELLEYMIKSPSCVMDLRQVNADGDTIFFQACKDSDVDVVSLLLYCKREDIGVNVCNTSGKSPVAIASENARKPGNKSVCIVTMLMESKRKVDVNCVDSEGKTALHRACESDSIFIANMLCLADNGCKHINLCDSLGHTPLYYAKNPDLVDLLIKFGADPQKCD